MKAVGAITTLGTAFLFSGSAAAFSVSDCIIKASKGVLNDQVIRLIAQDCQQKKAAYIREKMEELNKEFGEVAEVNFTKVSASFNIQDDEFHSVELANLNVEQTVRFVRLAVAPASQGNGSPCDHSQKKIYFYKVSVRPSEKTRLIYPSKSRFECVNPEEIRVTQNAWSDRFVPGVARPLEKDPFADIDNGK